MPRCCLQFGNAKYEHSILRAAGGLEWRSLVEEAAAKFKEAGEWAPGGQCQQRAVAAPGHAAGA